MIAIGAGGLDVALAMAGKPFYLTCPSVIKINLQGHLKPWVSAKDVILKVLEIFTTKGNVGLFLNTAEKASHRSAFRNAPPSPIWARSAV